MTLFAGLSLLQISIAIGACFIAAFVRGLAGFGLAIILVPILALALSPVEAVLTTNFIALAMGLSEMRGHLKEAERSAILISIMVILATWPGLWLLSVTPVALARLLIALMAICAFLVILFPVRDARRPSTAITAATGALSGLCTGFAGMPGLPVVPYYVGRNIPRHVAKASMLLIFTFAAFAGIGSGAALGALEWRLVGFAAALLPVVAAGNWLGAKAFGVVSDRVWRGFVALTLAATAIAALVKLL